MRITLSFASVSGTAGYNILKEGMEFISRAVKDETEWKKHKIYDRYEIECDVSEKEIMPVFYKLIEMYPGLDIFAVDSYDIREDDRSAQWWVTTIIKTKHHPDGTTTLTTESSTQWF